MENRWPHAMWPSVFPLPQNPPWPDRLQALGSMDVMTRAQVDFFILVTTREIQNQVMAAYDIRLQMLLQGSQLSTGTVEQSLTNCLADSMRTTFSILSKDLPSTVST